ncbi:carbohydrate-binding protein [Halorussus halobius]|uniref:hypothetical protein n=1 Tax=Halorussus halobius TaxID=1710537 RepID=UPI001092AC0B|nr:hypothetical protein [Halorussus halobius]
MPATFTTSLPDEDQPTLGNGVEDEVAVDRETAPSNYGSVRIQIRETGESSWDSSATGFGEFIGDHSTLTMEFVGRKDGEEYEVRARTETEHRTGSWTDPVSIVTKFPGVTSASITAAGQTEVDVEGTDNADNESGIRLQRQREYESGWRPPSPWRTVRERDPVSGTGAFAVTDDTAQPGRRYRYRFEPYTEHTSATSNVTEAVATTGSGRDQRRVPPEGWHIEVDHEPSGRTLTPQLLDDPQQQPRVNDLPQIRIPVPYNEKWQSEGYEDATLRVWQDGVRQPIETLVNVTHETQQGSKRTVLHGEGGRQLKQTVAEEYDLVDVHEAAGDLIASTTPYATDIDPPAESVRVDALMKTVDSETEWQSDPADAYPDTRPVTVTADGRFEHLQTSFTREGESASTQVTDERDGYSGGVATGLPEGATRGPYEFSLDYTVPDGGTGRVAIRYYIIGSQEGTDIESNPPFDVVLNDSVVDSIPANFLFPNEFGWLTVDIGDIANPGDYQIEIEAGSTSEETGGMYLDLVNFHDARFYSELPNSNDGQGGPLPGPRDYPVVSQEFADSSTGQQVVGGRADLDINDTSGEQAVAVSNDQGQTWVESSNSAVVDAEFDEPSSQLRARVTLDAYGSRETETPSEGFKPQSVDAYSLYADLDETPALINQSVKGEHLDRVLREWADQGGFIWEYTVVDGTPTVIWTQPGQRETDVDPDLVDYRTTKRSGEVYEAVTVVGAAQAVSGHRFEADVGAAVSLPHENLVDGSETVYDPETGANYTYNVDYTMSSLDGTVTVLGSGDLLDNAEYAIDYRYETRGSYQLDSVDSPRWAPKQSIPGLTSEEACEQAAATIVAEISEPLWEVEFSIPPAEVGFAVTDALSVAGLPVDKPVEAKSVENSPEKITVAGGNRETPGEVVRRIQERVGQIGRRS